MTKTERQFTAVFRKAGRWHLAWIEEIPGVNTQGRTVKEARENLKEALQLILETNRTISSAENYGSRLVRERIGITM